MGNLGIKISSVDLYLQTCTSHHTSTIDKQTKYIKSCHKKQHTFDWILPLLCETPDILCCGAGVTLGLRGRMWFLPLVGGVADDVSD